MNSIHPAAQQRSFETSQARFGKKFLPAAASGPVQGGIVHMQGNSQTALPSQKVDLALKAYAIPKIAFAGDAGAAKKFNYSDDELRDYWLSNDPRHEERWLKANEDADRLLAAIKAKGIDVPPTVFMIASPAKLLQVAARGLPNMPPDWLHGMSLYDLMQNESHGLGHIYELVLSTIPAVAYLLNTNTPVETRLVTAHVYGHTSFSKLNKLYKDTRMEEILNIVGTQRQDVIKMLRDMSIPRDPETQRNPVKEFMNKVHSIRLLIDLETENHPITDYINTNFIPPMHPQEATNSAQKPKAVLKESDRYLYSQEEWAKKQLELRKENAPKRKKFPAGIDRDILGFLAKHSPVLAPWQRRILQIQREQSYFFSATMRTKIMDEGWASFWHTKLMLEDPGTTLDQASEVAKMNDRVIRPSKDSLNPYWLGYMMWQDLYIKAGLGLKLEEDTPAEYINQTITSIQKNPKFDEKRAIEALKKVASNEEDYTFIERYLTPDLCKKLKLYTIETKENQYYHYYGGKPYYDYIKSKKADEVREALKAGLYYCGKPILEVVDANFEDAGELLINHSYTSDDLNVGDTKKTMGLLATLWGRPVHLDSYLKPQEEEVTEEDAWAKILQPDQIPDGEEQEGEMTPIRYTADPKTGEVTTWLRGEDGKALSKITINSDGTYEKVVG